MSVLEQPGRVFIAHGDLTQLRADAIVYSASTGLLTLGHLHGPFVRRFPWFADEYAARVQRERPEGVGSALGHAFWLREPADGPGVIVVASTYDRDFGTATRERIPREEIV